MQFHIFRKFILFALILFDIQNVYSADSKGSPSRPPRSSSKKKSSVELVTLNTENSFYYKGKECFSLYIYSATKGLKNKLADGKLLQQLIFDGKLLTVDNPTRFPNPANWLTIGIFVCKHNQPVMLRIKYNDKDSLDEKEQTDSNGLTYHPLPKNSNNKEYSKKIESVWKGLFSDICKKHKSTKVKLEDPPLNLLLIPPGHQLDRTPIEDNSKLRKESKPKKGTMAAKWKRTDSSIVRFNPSCEYIHPEGSKFLKYTYSLTKEDQNNLKFPKFIDLLIFNGTLLECDEHVQFPDLKTCIHLVLFSCMHNYPTLILFITKSGKKHYRYYYKLDPDTLTLKNTQVTFLDEIPETDKKTQLIRYPIVANKKPEKAAYCCISDNWGNMVGWMCKDHKESETTNPSDKSLTLCYSSCVKRPKKSCCRCC